MGHPAKYRMLTINTPRYGNQAIVADTFAELRSIPANKILPGWGATVHGGLARLDGLGGLFVWNENSTAEDDNETVICPTKHVALGRWEAVAVGQIGPIGPVSTVPGPKGDRGDDGDGIATVMAPGGASLVGFQQSGVGAAARTVQTKLRDSISVRDFGAVGDGATDDAPAFQAAVNLLRVVGGKLEVPRGRYHFASTVIIDRRYSAPVGGFYNGERTFIISAYGAEITSATGAVFEIRGGWAPNRTCVIEGLTINHRSNTTASHGIRLIGASLTTLRDIVVVVNGGLPAQYAAFQLENANPADVDSGCFWNLIERCGVRPWSGSDGNCDYGIRLLGTSNATVISKCILGGSNTHLHIGPHSGQQPASNATVVDQTFFEGPTSSTGIELNSLAPIYHVTGTRITNCRFEALDTAIKLTGSGTTVQLPTFMAGNYADTSVANYFVNPLNIPVVSLDSAIVGAAMPPFTLHNQRGMVVRNDNASFDALSIRGAANGRGLTLQRANGLLLARWALRPSLGSSLSGNDLNHPIFVSALGGISATATECQNVGGTKALVGGTATVTFPGYLTEVDANYRIQLTGNAAENFYVTGKSATGFTINSSNGSSTAQVDWFMYRA